MVGGGSDVNETAGRMGLPTDLVSEAENFKGCEHGIFPDNAITVAIFQDMLTQWRTGPGGIIGFDYNVLPFIFRTRRIKREEREDTFDCLQIMERAAINAIHQK